jgi:hypothetical protein
MGFSWAFAMSVGTVRADFQRLLLNLSRRTTIPSHDPVEVHQKTGTPKATLLNHAILVLTPEIVVLWHWAGLRQYWSWISRTQKAAGRKPISSEVRDLIFRMVAENPT